MSDEILKALARIEAKVDALSHFSGVKTDDGTPLTIDQWREIRRVRDRSRRVMAGERIPPTDSRGLPIEDDL